MLGAATPVLVPHLSANVGKKCARMSPTRTQSHITPAVKSTGGHRASADHSPLSVRQRRVNRYDYLVFRPY